MTRKKSSPPPPPETKIRQRLLSLLSRQPLDLQTLAKKLNQPSQYRAQLRKLINTLELEGQIVRVRKNRYVLPSDADLVVGIIQFHRDGSAHLEPITPGGREIWLHPQDTSTALHGDRVVVRIENPPTPQAPIAQPQGRVIRILQRNSNTIVGTLQKTDSFYYVVADDPRFPHNLYTPPPHVPANIGDKVVAELTDWPTRHVNPEGRIVEVLGPASAPGVTFQALIRKYHLPREFPPEVLREAEAASQRPDDHASYRQDHRHQFVFTIDPDDARDFDDAICVEKNHTGWNLSVHIADVSHFVRPRTALDKEARTRGNSVYLPEGVIPMLPEALSNHLCSLRPGEDRFVFSVHAHLDHSGQVISSKFSRGIIRSVARLTYKQALAHLQQPPTSDIAARLHTAWELAAILRKTRFQNGSLDLDFPEVKVILDPAGHPVQLEKIENDISHQLIEEFMLLANELVARELKLRRQPAIYRIHEPPDPERLEEFRQIAASWGIHCGDLTQRPQLQKLLAKIKGQPFESTLKIALLKSLKRARYSPEPAGHYGLHKSDYAHFTSPIRRYADLLVHRALEKLLRMSRSGPDARTLPAISEHISATERLASEAERESRRLKQIEFFRLQLERRTGATFHARIIEIRNYGLFIELPDCLFNGLIHISSIEGDFFIAEPARGQIRGRSTGRTFRVGDELEVIVARVDPFKQQVDFAIASPPPNKKEKSLSPPHKNRKLKSQRQPSRTKKR